MSRKKRSGAFRTKKGTVIAKGRKKYGMKGKGRSGKFPVKDAKSARSALKLRGHGKGVSRSAVIAKVSRWANAHNNASIKAAVKKARAADRKKKKKR